MFGSVSPMEILVILALALLFFGPKKLPEIGRQIGEALREFRRASQSFMEAVNNPNLLLEDDEPDRPPPKTIEFPSPPPVALEDDPSFETLPYGTEFVPETEQAKDQNTGPASAEGALASAAGPAGEQERKG